jgi:hypothetical protein
MSLNKEMYFLTQLTSNVDKYNYNLSIVYPLFCLSFSHHETIMKQPLSVAFYVMDVSISG